MPIPSQEKEAQEPCIWLSHAKKTNQFRVSAEALNPSKEDKAEAAKASQPYRAKMDVEKRCRKKCDRDVYKKEAFVNVNEKFLGFPCARRIVALLQIFQNFCHKIY